MNRRELRDQDLPAILENTFGIHLNPGEVAKLIRDIAPVKGIG